MADVLTTKNRSEHCFNCAARRDFTATYNHGQLIELTCTMCGITDSFPIDDEE